MLDSSIHHRTGISAIHRSGDRPWRVKRFNLASIYPLIEVGRSPGEKLVVSISTLIRQVYLIPDLTDLNESMI